MNLKDADVFQLYLGDTDGSLHILQINEKPIELNSQLLLDQQNKEELKKFDKKTVHFAISKSHTNFHRLHVIQLVTIPKDSFIFSIGFDQQVIQFQELSGQINFSYQNPHRCLFTAICWNDAFTELALGDELGYIYFINFQSEKAVQEFQLYDRKILSLHHPGPQQLIVVTDAFVDVLRIQRGIQAGNVLDAHTGSIIGLYAQVPAQLTSMAHQQPPQLISASLDNTLRVWDPTDMQCLVMMENTEQNQINCLHYLTRSNLFVSGHDNGQLKLWNIELNSVLEMEQHPPHNHSNSIACVFSMIFTKTTKNETTQYIFSSGYDGRVGLWELFEKKSYLQSAVMTSTIVPQLKNSIIADQTQPVRDSIGYEILCLNYDDTNHCVVAAGNRKKIYFIKFDPFQNHAKLEGHTDSVNCLVIESKILFSGSDDQTIRLWNLQGLYPLMVFDAAHTRGIRDLLILSETGHLASCAFDGLIKIWDYTTQQLVQSFEKNQRIRCLTYIYNKVEKEEDSQKKTQLDFMIYVGTEENNIYSFDLKELMDKRVQTTAYQLNFDIEQGTQVNSPLKSGKYVQEDYQQQQQHQYSNDEDQLEDSANLSDSYVSLKLKQQPVHLSGNKVQNIEEEMRKQLQELSKK